jgi:hypothetical protein
MLFISIVTLNGCVTTDNIKNENNKIAIEIDRNYEEVYRITIQNSQRCRPQFVVGNIFTDNKTATITDLAASGNFTYYTIDFIAIDDKNTRLYIYPAFDWQRDMLPGRILSWVLDGSTKCKFNGYPKSGPE